MPSFVATFCLAALSGYIFWRSINAYRRAGTVTFETLALLFFAIFYPLSGIAHLNFNETNYRGFFDIVRYGGTPDEQDLIFMTVAVVFVATIGIVAGLRFINKKNVHALNSYKSEHSTPEIIYGVFLCAIGLSATAAIFAQIDITAIERGKVLEPGSAKLAFASSWFGWGLSLLYLNFLSNKLLKSAPIAGAAFFVVVISISLNLVWTGGRSIVFLMALPLIMILLRLRRALAPYVLLPYAMGLFFYVVFITATRTEHYYSYDVSVASFVDWEFGRFSMVGYAIDYVERNGFLYGETWIFTVASILFSPFYMLGADASWIPGHSIVATVGEDILGSLDLTYIVPGLAAEAFMNFGMIGVFLSFFVVGILTKKIDYFFSKNINQSFNNAIFFGFLGSLICLNLLNTSVLGFLSYILYTGFPLAVALLISELVKKRRRFARSRS